MDNDRFDQLTRTLSSGLSRRKMLRGLVGAIGLSAATTPGLDRVAAESTGKCYGAGSRCTRGDKCCSGICTNRVCVGDAPSGCTPGETRSCYEGPPGTANVGVCRAGTETCTNGGVFGPCLGQVLPTAEICGNGVDDDCDGSIDEGCLGTCTDGVKNGNESDIDCGGSCPDCGDGQSCIINQDCAGGTCCFGVCMASGVPCATGLPGVCSTGTTTCGPGGVTCQQNVLPSLEVCDGLDNDCDEEIDEGVICPARTGAEGTCISGACEYACVAGFGNCNGTMTDGCETVLANNVLHCGFCGRVCPTPPNAQPICLSGACDFVCLTGFHRCGSACVSNNSPATCGTSCTPCPSPDNATATCVMGICGFQCDGGFQRCGSECTDEIGQSCDLGGTPGIIVCTGGGNLVCR